MLRSRIDRAFVRWRRTGDGRLLAHVFDGTAEALYRLGHHLLGDRHAAEDLVQHTFVVAIEQAESFVDRRGVFPWLCGILTHRAMHVRRQQRQRAGKGIPADKVADPAAEAAARELQETVAARVRTLPEPYRQVLLLHLVHELTPQEVAEALARPPATVRTQLARGFDLLRKALPVGIGGLSIAAVPPPLGLQVVRAAVLQHAERVVGTSALAMGSGAALLEGLAMKKTILAVLAALLAVTTWSWWHSGQVAPSPAPAGGLPGRLPPLAASVPPVNEGAPTIPRSEAPVAPDAPASLEVAVAWHDGTPAADIAVRVMPVRPDAALWLDVARTRGDGIARFPMQPPGVVSVRTDRGNAAKVELAAGVPQTVQLTIPRGLDVRGRVVDSEEQPVAGASVWLSVVPNSDENELAAISGADGTFAIRSAGLHHVVSATAPGHGCAKCAFVRERSANEELVVAVRNVPGVLAGVVVDDQGRAIAGARVLVGVCGWNRTADGEHTRMLGEVTGADVWPGRFVRSDADGRFRVDGLPAWSWPVWIGARGFGPLLQVVDVAGRGETSVTFQLGAPAIVTGTVRDASGTPVANASVGAHVKPPVIDERISLGVLAAASPNWITTQTTTDANGQYTMRGVLPGTLSLGAWSQQQEARTERTIAAGEVLEWNPVLARETKFEITGSLVDDAGDPVRGFDVFVTDARLDDTTVGLRADGTFRVRRADDLPFRIAAKRTHPGAGRPVPLGEFRPADCPLRLVVPAAARRGASLRGRLLRAGSPQTDGYVSVMSRDRRLWVQVNPDEHGAFVTGEVDPGSYDVAIAGASFGSYGAGTFELRAGECRDLGDLEPPPVGELVVTVVDRENHRRPEIWLRVRSVGGDRMAGWEAKHHESVTRGALPAGRYSLQTWDGPIAAMEVEVVAGRTTDVRFVLPDVVPFVLRLPPRTADVDQLRHEWRIDDRLVLGDRASLADQPNDERHAAPPGRYTIDVRDPDGNTATATFDLRAGEPPPVFELPLPRR